jgi:hypothetical protein
MMLYFGFLWAMKPPPGSWMPAVAVSILAVVQLVLDWYYKQHPLVPPA